jgi:hypothetical protein
MKCQPAAGKDRHPVQGAHALEWLAIRKHGGRLKPVVVVHAVTGRECSALGRGDAKRRVSGRPILRQALNREIAGHQKRRKRLFRFPPKECETGFALVQLCRLVVFDLAFFSGPNPRHVEAVGRDGGAQHGDDRDDIIFLPNEARNESVVSDLPPGDVDHKRGGDISRGYRV